MALNTDAFKSIKTTTTPGLDLSAFSGISKPKTALTDEDVKPIKDAGGSVIRATRPSDTKKKTPIDQAIESVFKFFGVQKPSAEVATIKEQQKAAEQSGRTPGTRIANPIRMFPGQDDFIVRPQDNVEGFVTKPLIEFPERIAANIEDLGRGLLKKPREEGEAPLGGKGLVPSALDDAKSIRELALSNGYTEEEATALGTVYGVSAFIADLGTAGDIAASGILRATRFDRPVTEALTRLGLREGELSVETIKNNAQTAAANALRTGDAEAAKSVLRDAYTIMNALEDKGIFRATGLTKTLQDIAADIRAPLGKAPVRPYDLSVPGDESLPGTAFVPGEPKFAPGLTVRRVRKVGGEMPEEGFSFYSPNKKENLTFDDAVAALKSEEQMTARKLADEIDADLKLKKTVDDAIGDWADGAENSIFERFLGPLSPDDLRYSLAQKGLANEQKAVIGFTREKGGPDKLYVVSVPEKDLAKVREELAKNGIEFRTLVPGNEATDVVVYDKGGALREGVRGFARNYGKSARVKEYEGRGDFIGADTRDEARAVYERIIDERRARVGDESGRRESGVRDSGSATTGTDGGETPAGGASVPTTAKRVPADQRVANPEIQKISNSYNEKKGLPIIQEGIYVPVDETRARSIADAYENLPVDDSANPEVKRAYMALVREINDQWDHAVDEMGMTFEPWNKEGQPYANSAEMIEDVLNNKHLYFFKGGEPHPFLSVIDEKTGFSANDKFRAIHDLYGHASEGYGFGPRGEENAWIKHSQMFSKDAQRALTTETRGQNSWVNFGKQNYNPDGTPKKLPYRDRPYADQKVALLPEEFSDFESILKDLDKSSLVSGGPMKPTGIERKMSIGPEKPKKITKAEDVLLRQRLRDEARGAKYGYKAGQRDAREEIFNDLRVKQDEISVVRGRMVEYIKTNLPTFERGKFLTMVSNAETQIDLAKAFVRVDKAAEAFVRKTLVSNIKKRIDSLADSNMVAADYREMIRDLVDGIELKGHRDETIARIQATQDFIDEQKALGKDVFMPELVLRSLTLLKRRSASNLSIAELENIIDRIDALEQLGRTKQRTIENLYDIEKQRRLDQVVAETVSIEKSPLFRAKPGERLTTRERFVNVFRNLANGFQHIDLSITPMDSFFDLLGGGDGSFASAPFRVFKQTTDTNYQSYLIRKNRLQDAAIKKADELGLDETNMERIGVHAARMQKAGMEKLEASGLKKDEIELIVLDANEQAFYDYLRGRLDSIRGPIAEVMRTVYNRQLGQVENYFSFMTDWDAMSETEVFERIGENVQEFGAFKKNPEMGFTEKRIPSARQKIKLNALEIYLKHTDNAAYLIEMARDNRMLVEIAKDPAFKEAAGDLGARITQEWLDLVARKGGKGGDEKIQILDTLRRNVGIARLGFKLSSAIVQPTALMDGATILGPRVFAGLRDVVTRKDIRQFVLDNMPEVKARVADDPAFLDQYENKTLEAIREAGYWALKQLDALTASSVGWSAYLKKLDDLGIALDLAKPNKEALSYAQEIVRRTQSSGVFKDAPLAISRGKLTGNRSFDRALLQFQSFMLARWANIRHTMFRGKIMGGVGRDKNKRDLLFAFNQMFWLSMAVLTEVGLRRASQELLDLTTGRDDSGDDGYTEQVALSALSTVPYISPIIGMSVYGGEPIPALGFAGTLAQGVNRVTTGATDETKMRGVVNILEASGLLLGIPGSTQAGQLIRGGLNSDGSGDGMRISPIKIDGIQAPSPIKIKPIKVDTIKL